MIYLDNAATTKPSEDVIEVMNDCLLHHWYNPSSSYAPAKIIRNKIEKVRELIATTIHCKPQEIIFTSSGSEANNLAIHGVLYANPFYGLVKDNISHSSIHMNKCYGVTISNDKYGFLIPKSLGNIIHNLKFKKDLYPFVSINAANNEIGTIQDIKKISTLVHKNNGIIHIDAVQLFPDRPINVKELDIDMMSVSGHKFGTPSGIGFLYVKEGISLSPIISGQQEFGSRGGTESSANILGLGKAIENIQYHCLDTTLKELQKYVVKSFDKRVSNSYLVGSPLSLDRLTNHISICLKGVDASSLISYLSLYDIYISGGSACDSSSLTPSHVLQAIGLSDKDLHSCIRITLSKSNTKEDIDMLINHINTYKQFHIGGALSDK